MAKKKSNNAPGSGLQNVEAYQHKEAKRKNNPPASIAGEGSVPVVPEIEYSYSPRRPPMLRFDATGGADSLPDLLVAAKKRKLTDEEVRLLADALRTQEPWLEWAGKREAEARGLSVDPVALHIHERISAQAILRVAARQDVERTLFGDPEQEYQEAVQFYKHDIAWTNRLILGDSLHVMASLAHREDLAGKVQMIYMDPPYGIKYGSNFQPQVGRREVSDKDADLTRELEMVRAYRDTWHLGVHSYLSYLRDRLLVARELLSDSGSFFLQISDEHLHRVRQLMDEVFGPDNFASLITFQKTSGSTALTLPTTSDYLVWYAKDASKLKFRKLYKSTSPGEEGATEYKRVETRQGELLPISHFMEDDQLRLPEGAKILATDSIVSKGGDDPDIEFGEGSNRIVLSCRPNRHWKPGVAGIQRLWNAGRLLQQSGLRIYKRFFNDFSGRELNHVWTDTRGEDDPVYVVQTSTKVVERCILMTTDPGDIVLDPTCGSGTTALVAEQWGRRWITTDTSRVAVALARQRLLTARFDYFDLRPITPAEDQRHPHGQWLSDPLGNLKGKCTFKCESIPHITQRSIARNTNLDPIIARYDAILDGLLKTCNVAVNKVSAELRRKLDLKLLDKQRARGKRFVTDADRRRWQLPEKGSGWVHWTVPFDTDPDYPKELAEAVKAYRKSWRAKMDEVNSNIGANAESEELVDRPEVARGLVRVTGPFTIEAVQPAELSLMDHQESPIGGAPESLDAFEVKNVESYLDQMVRLLRMDGVRFPNNKESQFTRLERISGNDGGIHAEGRWVPKGEQDPDPDGRATVAVGFGPQYGPVTAMQVEDVIRAAHRRGYDDLVVAGFSFDGPAQTIINEVKHPKLRIHVAHIRPDVNPAMDGLLKQKAGSQLFTVFGQPRTLLKGPDRKGEYTVVMQGVDIYDPVTNTIRSTEDQKVAAWFIDGDYDGRTFCVTQAFFPDKSAWEKLSNALGGMVDPDRFEALSGTVSLPFPPGKYKCVAVKVIDPRGNEVMQVHKLG